MNSINLEKKKKKKTGLVITTVKSKYYLNYQTTKSACEDKFEFENLRRNSKILATPSLALTEQNLGSTEHC